MKTAFALLLTLGVALPVPAEAFIFIRGQSFAKGARPVSAAPIWNQRVVKFYVNTNLSAYGGGLSGDVTSAEFLQAAQDAINAWAAACRADLRVEFAGTTTAVKNASDSQNVIVYDNRTSGEGNEFGAGGTNILAAATSALANNEFVDCDILVNGNQSGSFDVDGVNDGDNDLASVLAHEVGHCLGLDHPIEGGSYDAPGGSLLWDATMVQTADVVSVDPTTRRTIDQDDIDGIECIYERGRGFRGGKSCTSYHGTNGGSAISGSQSGGPSAVENPKLCSTDGDANTARPNIEDEGTGCVPAAIASTSGSGTRGGGSPWRSLGSAPALLAFITMIYVARRRLGKKA